jgi:hypothetical protein
LARSAAVLALLVALLVAVPAARADGDPASDYLITQHVFFPFQTKISKDEQELLRGTVQDANDKGFRIRVALIASEYDLGSVTILWRKPQQYAKFLSSELTFIFKGPLLTVMPNGVGFWWHGRATAAERRLVARLRVPATQDGLAAAAITAVQRLGALHGIHVTATAASSGSHRNRNDRLVIVVAVVVALACAWLVRLGVRLRQRA